MRREEPVATDDPAYQRAFEGLKANSDTRWSPWLMIDGNDEEKAAVAALSAIADAWAEAMPAEPPHLVMAPVRA
jgi:polyphosphate kinase 2 (PPK2 family)